VTSPIPLDERLVRFFKTDKYRGLLAQAALAGRKGIPVDFSDLMAYDEGFTQSLVRNPVANLPALDKAAHKQLQIEDPAYAATLDEFRARVIGLPNVTAIRELRASILRQMVMVDGLVARASAVKPILKVGLFKCRSCGSTYAVRQDAPRVKLPAVCETPACRTRRPNFELVPEESTYADYQVLGLQEKPEDLPPGQLPRIVEVRARDDLVDLAAPGDRVVVVGVVQSTQERAGELPLKTFRLYLDAVSVETASKEPLAVQITPEEEREFRRLAEDPFIHRKLQESIAPSVYGLEHIKEGMLLLLFGGRTKVFPDGLRVRGEPNILLVGDPGTAKSQLLQYLSTIAPRGLYTSGRGSTAAGLTAAVVREKAGGMVLEAGAMVMADMGICCIDEIDKMRPEDRVAIHEAMAQQTVSIAKGGIVATLNARTAVLAAANPSLGRYDPYRNFTENVNLPITILSRFDLIFVLRDEPNPDQDRKVSSHIAALHSTGAPVISPPFHPELLRKYVAYAKRIEPVLTPEAMKMLEEFYLQMRSMYEKTSTVSITARQLESLIRLTEARARVALREQATEEDAAASILLMKRSLAEVGVDIDTGRPDIDVLLTGKPKSVRDKLALVVDTVKKLEERQGFAADEELRNELLQAGLTEAEIGRLLTRLITEGRIYTPKTGAYKVA